ncbi:MAG: hypothetical protein JWO11_1898 [Nocardioides sp.]|nr:hypothetical protein [Nocardioides sp.]
MTEDEEVRDRLTRIEGKIDVLVMQHGHATEQVTDHEQRLRVIEAAQVAADVTDHEQRLRTVERWKYALPVSMGGGVLAAAAAILAAIKGG